jgi:hypothetical protein
MGISDVGVLRANLEQYMISNREFLAVCICVKCQHAIIENFWSVESGLDGIKELMGMKLKVVHNQRGCLLCHEKKVS